MADDQLFIDQRGDVVKIVYYIDQRGGMKCANCAYGYDIYKARYNSGYRQDLPITAICGKLRPENVGCTPGSYGRYGNQMFERVRADG